TRATARAQQADARHGSGGDEHAPDWDAWWSGRRSKPDRGRGRRPADLAATVAEAAMTRRRLVPVSATIVLILVVGVGLANAQFAVFDPALALKNAAIAGLNELLRDTLGDEADQLYRMAKRLSAFADLGRFFISDDDTPQWRIHVFFGDEFLFANA